MVGMNDEVYFHEEQRLRQWWLWALVVVSLVIVVVVLVRTAPHAALVVPHGGRRSLISALILGGALFVAVLALLASTKLVVEVRRDGVYFRFVPFHRRIHRFGLDEIVRHEACRYRPLRDYGGWGIRGLASDRAYNVSGDRGVRLHLRDGRRVLFGSQRPAEFDAALLRALSDARR